MGSALSELTDKMTGLQNNIDRSLVNLTKITEVTPFLLIILPFTRVLGAGGH